MVFVLAVLAVLGSLRRMEFRPPAWAELVPAYVLGSVAVFWFVQRIAVLMV